jgi:hypothetical protein
LRTIKVQVMMSPAEVETLDQIAASRGLSRSALLRQLVLTAQRGADAWGGTTTPPHVVIGHWSQDDQSNEVQEVDK